MPEPDTTHHAPAVSTSAPRAPVVALGADDPLLLLVYEYFRQKLRVLESQRSRAWEGVDPEGVHQMRIAARRIRGTLGTFKRLLPGDGQRDLRAQFRWLSRTLGDVRDLDVYRQNYRQCLKEIPSADADALGDYERWLAVQGDEAQRRLRDALDSDGYRQLMVSFAAFVQRGPSRADLERHSGCTIEEGMTMYVGQAAAKLVAHGSRLTGKAAPEALHKLRIEAKRFRYLLGLFGKLADARIRRVKTTVKALQDVLGEYQDFCTAVQRLRSYSDELPPEGPREELIALGRLMQNQQQRADAARQRFGAPWRRFEQAVAKFANDPANSKSWR